MRRALWITVVMLIGVGAPAPMHASKALMEGMTPCGFGIEFTQPAAVDGTLHLRVGIGGYYDSTAVGEVRIVIPRDVQLVAGDTLIRTLVVGDPRRAFPLVIRPRWPGIYIISAVAAVSVPGIRVDESEVEISAEVRSDTTVLGTCRVVRQETVRGGQRYRYAGPLPRAHFGTGADHRRRHLCRQAPRQCVSGNRGQVPELHVKPVGRHDVGGVCCAGWAHQGCTAH